MVGNLCGATGGVGKQDAVSCLTKTRNASSSTHLPVHLNRRRGFRARALDVRIASARREIRTRRAEAHILWLEAEVERYASAGGRPCCCDVLLKKKEPTPLPLFCNAPPRPQAEPPRVGGRGIAEPAAGGSQGPVEPSASASLGLGAPPLFPNPTTRCAHITLPSL
jgi:hypothetical protein